MNCLFCSKEIGELNICPHCGWERPENAAEKGGDLSGEKEIQFAENKTQPIVPPTGPSPEIKRRAVANGVKRDKARSAPSVLQYFLIFFVFIIPVVNIIAAACWAIGGGNRSRQNMAMAFLIWMSILLGAFLISMVLYGEEVYNYIRFVIDRLDLMA